jgi:signal transduction histidine kinase
MRSFRDLSIRHKLTLLLVVIVSVALLLTATATTINELRGIRLLMVNQFSTLANVLAANSAPALSVDPSLTQQVLSDLRVEPAIVFACTYDAQGNVAARYQADNMQPFTPPPPAPDGFAFTRDGHLEVFKQAKLDNEMVGTVYVRATTKALDAQIRRAIGIRLGFLLASVAVAVLLSLWLQRLISSPILRLAAASERVSQESDFSVRVAKQGNDEIGVLSDAFNSMLAQIQQRDEELEQHRAHLEELVHERTRNLEAKTAEFERANVDLARSNAELQQFAFVSSHDLQEPLRKVQAFSNLLLTRYRQMLDEPGQDYLNRMTGAAARMATLVDGLLAYSQVTADTRPYDRVELSEVAHAVVADFERRIAETRGRVEIGPLPSLVANRPQMEQLLRYLVDNGLKFQRPGVPPVLHIEGRIINNGDGVELPGAGGGQLCQITIRDNGIGFDEKYLDRIFTPYERLHTRGAYEGTGMGLTVCRKIVHRHGGTITARSTPQSGATFIVTLPVERN